MNLNFDKHLPCTIRNISKQAQLAAIVEGLSSFYRLLELYVGDLSKAGDLRLYINITKTELVDYLRNHPEIIKKHLHKEGSPRYHEQPIIEYDEKIYRVYEMDYDEPRDIKEYNDFAEAMADYVICNLGLPPGLFKNP